MKLQPSIITAAQVNTYIHYLVEIDRVQRLPFSYHHGFATGKEIRSVSGKPSQTAIFIWLEDNDFIKVIRGRENRYALKRPLSSILLTEIVHRTAIPVTSPLFKLLTSQPTLSLTDVIDLTYPNEQFPYPGTLYSFDFMVRLLIALNDMKGLTYSQICFALGGYRRSYTYTIGALGELFRAGLIHSCRLEGYRLYQSRTALTMEALIPVVSHRDTLFNKMLYASRALPLSLFDLNN